MKKTVLALCVVAATPALAQIVYVNSPDVSSGDVSFLPSDDSATLRYRTSNSSTDFLIGNGGPGSFSNPAVSRIGWNAGGTSTLYGTEVSFVIENTPNQGLAFYAQFDATGGGSPTTGVAAWGTFAPPITQAPSELGNAAIASPNVAATLVPFGGTATTPTFAYNSLGVTFSAGNNNKPNPISVDWNSLQFSGTGLTVNGGGFNNGSITVAPSGPGQASTQYAFSQTDLSQQAWKLTGKVTLTSVTPYPADSLVMDVVTLNTSFTPVPEPAEYVAAVGGVALFGGLLLRRRRTQA